MTVLTSISSLRPRGVSVEGIDPENFLFTHVLEPFSWCKFVSSGFMMMSRKMACGTVLGGAFLDIS